MRMEDETGRRTCLGKPRSSTHCELVGLSLAMELRPTEIITDLLTALRLPEARGRLEMPAKQMTEHPDRRLGRRLLKEAKEAGFPTLEKVKAHDEGALEAGIPKAVGNSEADRHAKQAVKKRAGPKWQGERDEFRDPMELRTRSGALVNEWKTERSKQCGRSIGRRGGLQDGYWSGCTPRG